jgi:hypothetical protein
LIGRILRGNLKCIYDPRPSQNKLKQEKSKCTKFIKKHSKSNQTKILEILHRRRFMWRNEDTVLLKTEVTNGKFELGKNNNLERNNTNQIYYKY